MAHWHFKIKNFKSQILEDKNLFTAEEIQNKTKLFWSIVKHHRNAPFMQEFIEEYEGMYHPESMSDVKEFDELLRELYDYCDFNSIWVD